MSFDAKQKPISELLTNTILVIPRNQRRYVWKKDNWRDLLDDLKFTIRQHNKRQHFIGCIVLQNIKKEDDINYYNVIDGQQRSITIALLLATIMKIFKERGLDDFFAGTSKFLYQKDSANKEHYVISSDYHLVIKDLLRKLKDDTTYNKSVDTFLKGCVSNATKDKPICDCFKFFYEYLKDKEDDEIIAYRKTITDMQYVHIVSDTDEDSYTVFEILNARGVNLEDSELVKNYIMRYIEPQDSVDDVKLKWDDMDSRLGSYMPKFFKHYATHRYGKVLSKEIFATIKKKVEKDNVHNLLDDIVKKSQYYIRIVKPMLGENIDQCDTEEYPIFFKLSKHKAEQVRPVLLSLINAYENNRIDKATYIHAIDRLYKFYICYSILGKEKSNKLQDTIDKYAPLMEENFTKDIVSQFISNMYSKLPSKNTFSNALNNVGWSHSHKFMAEQRSKKQVNAALELIECALSESQDANIETIEHVLNDAGTEDNSIIGNLLPLEATLNTNKLSEKTFEEKLDVYENSKYATTRAFVKRYKYTSFEPKERTYLLASYLYNEVLKVQDFI